MMNQVAQL